MLDVTDAVKAGTPNRLAVRVLNPTAEPIDGIVLIETPHRNKVPAGIKSGASYNSGGITEPVEVVRVPAVRLDDVYVRPDWKTGRVTVEATVMNAGKSSANAQVHLAVASARGNEPLATLTLEQEVPPGRKVVRCELTVADHRLWQLDDPYLYRLTTRLISGPNADAHERVTRFGFRELRVEKGYFRLNGKRIFLKSSHTGNHCPVGAVLPPASAPDLLRKDLLYMKSCGLQPPGIMDWDYYGPLITNRFFEGQDTPEEIAVAAFAICHSSRPDGYAAGTMLSVCPLGSGRIVLNTLNILDNVDKHPAADRLLMNVITYAARNVTEPPSPGPANVDATTKEMGH